MGEYAYQNRLPDPELNHFFQEIDDLKNEINELLAELDRRNQVRSLRRQNDRQEVYQRIRSLFTSRPGAPTTEREVILNLPPPGRNQTDNSVRTCPYCLTAIQPAERTIVCPVCETPTTKNAGATMADAVSWVPGGLGFQRRLTVHQCF